MDEPLISVIVPVYKVEQYLERCVDSILKQTYQNLEIILVDDGSPDNCPAMCDAVAHRDDRVKVIHQENGGLSAARNAGLRLAKGKYVMFVDSDDWLCLCACEKLAARAEEFNCDVVYAKKVKIVGDAEVHMSKQPAFDSRTVCDGKTFLVSNVRRGTMPMCAQYALYKKEKLTQRGIFFREGIVHEDELWTPQVYLAAKRVSFLDYEFYYHYQHEGSIKQTLTKEALRKRARDLLRVCDELDSIYRQLPKQDQIVLYDYLCMLYLNAIYIGQLTHEDRRFPLRTAHSLKNRVKAMIHAVSPSFYIWLNRTVKRAGSANKNKGREA